MLGPDGVSVAENVKGAQGVHIRSLVVVEAAEKKLPFEHVSVCDDGHAVLTVASGPNGVAVTEYVKGAQAVHFRSLVFVPAAE